MISTIIIAVIAMAFIGVIAAVILYYVAQKFKVIEDPKIDEIAEQLPGANCGGCGFAGCRNFAETIVKSGTMEGLNCPVGGNSLRSIIGGIMGVQVTETTPQVAVVRCNGNPANAPLKVKYDGPFTCQFVHGLFAGENGCPYGCLGLGDCVQACKFEAMYMDPVSGLPVIIEEKCVACGACVKACPRMIIEMRNKGPKGKRIFVSCVNREKGVFARKNCSVACIGCNKCVKICPHDAISLENNLAYINYDTCKLCRKCVPECPTDAIHEMAFPVRKPTTVSNEQLAMSN